MNPASNPTFRDGHARDERAATPHRTALALPDWLHRLGLLNDYVRIPFANGSSFASQFLYRELRTLGAEVSVIGPHDPDATSDEMPERHVSLRSVPLRNHPGVHLAMPSGEDLARLRSLRLDLVLGQTCNALMDAGVYLRALDGVPLLMVNTVHLPSVYNAVLPDAMAQNPAVHAVFEHALVPLAESQTVDAYNRGDGLVVLSEGMRRYWLDRGVEVPIHVIPRAIEKRIFDRVPHVDPFDARARPGGRLLVVCRHVREKNVSRLLTILARHVFPRVPEATLTLVGDGPDHEAFVEETEALGIADRCFFVGERSLTSMPDYYAHADLFVYTSLSETYGQVISEALYSGLPVVAFADGMGVSGQVSEGFDGRLVSAGPEATVADAEFGAAVLSLLASPGMRRAYAEEARRRGRERSDPRAFVRGYLAAFESAREHRDLTWRPRALAPAPLGPLVRWAGMHALVAGLGLLREPVRMRSDRGATPDWALRAAG